LPNRNGKRNRFLDFMESFVAGFRVQRPLCTVVGHALPPCGGSGCENDPIALSTTSIAVHFGGQEHLSLASPCGGVEKGREKRARDRVVLSFPNTSLLMARDVPTSPFPILISTGFLGEGGRRGLPWIHVLPAFDGLARTGTDWLPQEELVRWWSVGADRTVHGQGQLDSKHLSNRWCKPDQQSAGLTSREPLIYLVFTRGVIVH
jgi:hypothetical protein